MSLRSSSQTDCYTRIQALAERDPRRAVRLARAALAHTGSDSREKALYTLGWSLLRWERFDDARRFFQDCLKYCDAGQDELGTLHCRYGLLLADLMQRGHAGLLPELTGIAVAFTKSAEPRWALHAQIYHAVLLNILGRPRDAESLLEEIAPLIGEHMAVERARWLRVGAATAYGQGRYLVAVDLLGRAERQFSDIRMSIEVACCWYEQAAVAIRQERFDVALDFYRRAHLIFVRFAMVFRRARCEKDRGYVLALVGAYDRALEQTARAAQYFSASNSPRDLAGCYLHMGNIYFQTGRWELALASYSRAETLFSDLGASGDLLVVRRNCAMTYRARGQRPDAQRLVLACACQAQALGNAGEVAEAHSLLAALKAEDGDVLGALIGYQDVYRQFVALNNQPAAAACLLEQGWLLLHREAIAAAQARFAAALPALGEQPHHQWRAVYGLARCAEANEDRVEALGRYQSACATVAGLRQRLFSETISSSLYAQAARMHHDALRLAGRAGDVPALLSLSEEQRALVLRRLLETCPSPLPATYADEYHALRHQIRALLHAGPPPVTLAHELEQALEAYNDLLIRARHTVPEVFNLSAPGPQSSFNLAQLRGCLAARYGEDWTALVYIIVDALLWIIVVTPKELTFESTPYDDALQYLVERAAYPAYRRYTYHDLPYRQGQVAERFQDLRHLADRLLPSSVRPNLHPNHRLLIVPVDHLHQLAWSALRFDDRWLAESAIVQLVPSLTSMQILANRAPIARRALLIGCRTFGERAPELPGVAEELAAVAARLAGETEQLRDSQATRAVLLDRASRNELAGYGLLHIASHAQLQPTRGLAAHLKLWDDDLWLPEIVGLRLDGALVTLSACHGAATDRLPGEEVLSLTWAFLAAGASGVLASLWPVYDRAALRIMELFYERLHLQGDAPAALAAAQRVLIQISHANGDPVAEPLCWASFVAVGAGSFIS